MPRYLQIFAIFSLASLSLVSCSGQKAPADNPNVGPQPGAEAPGASGGTGRGAGRAGAGAGGAVPVTTAKVETKAVPVTIPSVGAAEAAQTVQIRAQVTGQLSAVNFAEGQEVKKGDLLFTIDPRPFEAVVAQAEAVLSRDTATATNQAAQRARYEDLYKRQLLPRDQYETQMAASESAQATLAADKATLDSAKLNVLYTRISAPIGGRTGSLGVHTGDLIRANDTNPMVVINQLAPIYVTFSVPGRYLNDIRHFQSAKPLTVVAQAQSAVAPGSQAQAPSLLQSLPPQTGAPAPSQAAPSPGTAVGFTESGTVTFIDNSVDPATSTIKLKGTFPNTNHSLWPGLYVQVTLNLTTEPNDIVVPSGAVQVSQSGQFVYVVKPDRTVEARPVTINRQQGELVVIADGVKAGEEIVVDGQLRLTPGMKITIVRGPGAGRGAGGPQPPTE